MLKKNTLLIVGAGAGYPYWFPTGPELITRMQSPGNIAGTITSGPADLMPMLGRLSTKLTTCTPMSIDDFLAQHDDVAEIGTAALVASIAYCERQFVEALRSGSPTVGHSPEQGRYVDRGDNWYKVLWHSLIEDAKSIDDFGANPLRVITFNYDRSLAHYLCTRAKSHYSVSDQDVVRAVRRFGFHAVHGSLGSLWDEHGNLQLITNTMPTWDECVARARNVRLMRSLRSVQMHQQFAEALSRMYEVAERVLFLGFGFHPTNCHLLSMRHYDHNDGASRCCGEWERRNCQVDATAVDFVRWNSTKSWSCFAGHACLQRISKKSIGCLTARWPTSIGDRQLSSSGGM